MTDTRRLTVGTLGGPGTFAHQGTLRLEELHPELGDITYLPTMDGVWAALAAGDIDLAVLSEQTSRLGWGEADEVVAPVDAEVYVYAAAVVPYGCSLLVREGTALADVDAVYGHGSIRQCRRWLDAHLPGVPATMHEKNSVEAAREVAAGDGTKAVVGTTITAELTGLVPLATGIDEGATGLWWAMSATPRYAEAPDTVIVAARCGGDGELGRLVGAVERAGPGLVTAYSQGTGERLHEYDHLLTFRGPSRLADVHGALAPFGRTRLVGAYRGGD